MGAFHFVGRRSQLAQHTSRSNYAAAQTVGAFVKHRGLARRDALVWVFQRDLPLLSVERADCARLKLRTVANFGQQAYGIWLAPNPMHVAYSELLPRMSKAMIRMRD